MFSFLQIPFLSNDNRSIVYKDISFECSYKYAIPLNHCSYFDIKNGILIQKHSIIPVINKRVVLQSVNSLFNSVHAGFINTAGIVDFSCSSLPELTFLLCDNIPPILPNSEKTFSVYSTDAFYSLNLDLSLFKKYNLQTKSTACTRTLYFLNSYYDEINKMFIVNTLGGAIHAFTGNNVSSPITLRKDNDQVNISGLAANNYTTTSGCLCMTGNASGFTFFLTVIL